MQKNIKIRLDSLDALRYIAAVLVLFSHLFEVFIVPKHGWGSFVGSAVSWVGIMAVLCFFYLSGYVIAFATDYSIASKKYSFGNYCKKRFFRIYPVVWGMLIYALIVIYIMKAFDLNGLTDRGLHLNGDVWSEPNFIGFKYLLYSIFLPPSGFYGGFFDLPLWTVSYEIAFYIIYGFIINLVLKYGIKKSVLIIVFILGALFTWYCIFMQPDDVSFLNAIYLFSSNFPCWNFFGFLFVWLLGVGCFYFTKHLKNRVYLYIGIATILIINIILFLHYICDIPLVYNPYPGLIDDSCPSFSIFMTLAYSFPMLLFVYWLQFIKLPKYLIFISVLGKKYSYTLYASHFILLNFAFGVLSSYLNQYNTLNFIILFMVLFVLANVIAFYLAKILENRDLWIKLYDSFFEK
ncbi:acyltransferase family protein [Francisella uliginis]|uniref:Acyltransferase 3 domain-containing protein n=1 Tax=Francisella uliginis TaxID=573570 RepID=A0A1L4BTE7_9GAMM|nr:acyltransferase [Francisella uliginis]API87118.1 hypothetical protein F7310_07000 [Francisella uliginis]